MKRTHDPIADALEVAPLAIDFEIAKAEPLTFSTDDEVKDYEVARQQVHDLMAKGNQALEMLMLSAAENPSVGKFEVLTNLIKTMGDMSMQLLDVQSKYKNLCAVAGKSPAALEDGDGPKRRGSMKQLLAEAKRENKELTTIEG